MEQRREQPARGPRREVLQDTNEHSHGPRQFVGGRRWPAFPDGQLHVVVRRRGPRDRRVQRLGQRRAQARDEVWVVRGVVRAHGGPEAPEVQREARVAAMQLLRLAEQVCLECLRCVREPDAVGADLGEAAKLGWPESQRPPCLGCQGYPIHLGFLHA